MARYKKKRKKEEEEGRPPAAAVSVIDVVFIGMLAQRA
jgi:hypothetical protein